MPGLAFLVFVLLAPMAQASFESDFRAPPMSVRPKLRWWWPGAAVDAAELARELREMSDSGFGGAEIASLPPPGLVDLNRVGWDRPAQAAAFHTAFQNAGGLRLDFTLGPSWPLSVPTVATLEDPRVEQELVYGSQIFTGQFKGPVPPPAGGRSAVLIAVTAARVISTEAETKPVRLAGLLDLTRTVHQGQVIFRPLDHHEHKWILFGFWRRPTGQMTQTPVSSQPAYVIDHFSRAATRALIQFWDEHLLTPALRESFRLHGGDFFADSLEIAANQLWTPSLREEFQRRRGYDLTRFLPILHIENIHQPYAGFLGGSRSPDDPPDFEIEGGARIRWDYYQTLNDLMEQNHLAPLARWAKSRGARLRYQPAFGTTLNLISNARYVDVPETESLHSGNQIDYHRAMASAAHVMGKALVSNECCAEMSGDYGQTVEEALKQMNLGFAGGVNQVVMHGRPYRFTHTDVAWPGWQPFSPQAPVNFSEAWDSRQPYFTQISDLTGYLARVQLALRTGGAQVDLAIYRQSIWWPAKRWFFEDSAPPFYADETLAKSGFTYDFVDPSLFESLQVKRTGGEIYLGRPGYRALVLDHVSRMDLSAAERISTWVEQGLHLVILGDSPHEVPGFRPEQDAQLVEIFTRLQTHVDVSVLHDARELPGVLTARGETPAFLPASNQTNSVLSIHRVASAREIYFLYNRGLYFHGEVNLRSHFAHPVYSRLNTWTGRIEPMASRQVQLAPWQTALIMITAGAELPAAESESEFSASSRQELTSWHLQIEDWSPTGVSPQELNLARLQDWREIVLLKGVSGIGHYRTSFEMPARPSAARLRLGRVEGKFRVRLNGRWLGPLDPFINEIDITPYVQAGPNILEVDVATTLRNRLITLWQSGWEEQMRGLYRQIGAPVPDAVPYSEQPAGLMGPVWVEY